MTPPNSQDQKKSKITVVVLILIILTGAGIWAYLEFSADIMVSRNTSMDFAADFEKRCQGKFEPDYCKKFAGLNHSTCFRAATRPGEDNVVYDQDAYDACMKEAQAKQNE